MGIDTKKGAPWQWFVARRFSRVDRKGSSSITGFLSSLGIAFGVMTLIVTMAVMNGFQSGSIRSILELSSAHVRITKSDKKKTEALSKEAVLNKAPSFIDGNYAKSVTPMLEAQSLIVGPTGKQSSALLKFVPKSMYEDDKEFSKQLSLKTGTFLNAKKTIVLGITLARTLGVSIGDTVNLLALSGGSDVALFSQNRVFTVSGIYSCSFAEINASLAFLTLEDGFEMLSKGANPFYSVKLFNEKDATKYSADMKTVFKDWNFESWQSFNRSFFGALRIEKNLLLLLVFLIFIVVAVNIFNSMRRMVFERSAEIAVLSALGASPSHIQRIFITKGFQIGFFGAVPGLFLGLLLSVQMERVFELVSKITYGIQYFLLMIVQPSQAVLLSENPMYSFYGQIPAQARFGETAFIVLFGLLSSLFAAWFASRKILKISVAEVLHDE